MSLVCRREVQESPSQMEKPINEDKRQKTWGLDSRLVVNSSLMEVRGLHKLPGHGVLWVHRSC